MNNRVFTPPHLVSLAEEEQLFARHKGRIPDLVPVMESPQLIWYQTDTKVVIRVQLANVEFYEIRLFADDRNLFFMTDIDDVEYGFLLHYWGDVIPDQWIHDNNGKEIKIILTKAHSGTSWLRLSRHSPPYIPITMDPDYVGNEKDDLVKRMEKDLSIS